MCALMYTHTHTGREQGRSVQMSWSYSYRQCEPLSWVLGTKFRSTGSTLNYLATSPARFDVFRV